MFLNFGKKSPSTKKPASPVESPKPVSPLGASSPVSRSNNAGSRSTVQTTAGPLLSSSRFNTILDASTYANVNSPGFTSRVVNCASRGGVSYYDKSETHQSKYSSVGLFPSVQLRGLTLPALSPRNSQKVRTPVRVRIAPPSFIDRRRHSFSLPTEVDNDDRKDSSKRSPSSIEQNLYKESSTPSTKISENGTSMPDNFQEASRKRIFSECQDANDESKKRRRKVEIPIPNPNNDTYHYRHVRVPAVPSGLPPSDIASQGKRAREKGSPEEQKRQRRKVCNTNNAIFSSLSSSRNLLERLTAQKRKSVDTSRSSSPLTPLSGKQVKESKAVTNAKAVQNHLGGVPQRVQFSGEPNQLDGTPVSSKTIMKRSTSSVKESADSLKKSSSNESPQTLTCDYTTKLFRKEVSHTPRTPTSKTPKQSLWVQPPEADELTCSLLNDDSKLHRPERLRSLLACVSGKDNKIEEKATAAAAPATVVSASASLPVSTGLQPQPMSGGSLSSALTVTVSSTCTIMTSATVTSVNGVPSSESGRSPPPPVSLLSSSSLTLSSQPSSSIPLSSVLSPVKASVSVPQATGPALPGVNMGQATSESVVSLPSLPLGQTTTSSVSLFSSSNSLTPSTGSSGNGLSTTTLNTVNEGIKTASNMFNMKSPLNNSGSSPTPAFPEAHKPTFQLGNGSSSTVAANSTFQYGSATSTSAPSAPTSSAFQFLSSQTNPAFSTTEVIGSSSSASKPTLSFGSSGGSSGDPKSTGADTSAPLKPAFSFGSSANVSSEASKAAFQFSVSGSSETGKPAFQFASIGTSSSGQTPNSSFSLGSSGASINAPSEAPKSAVSFGSVGNGPSVTANASFQFGAPATSSNASSAHKPAIQFGSTVPSVTGLSETQKPTFQFSSTGTASNAAASAPKAAFQFGSGSNSLSTPSKPAFQFNSSSNAAVQTPKPTPSFGSTNSGSAAASKPAFQFAASSNGPAANASSAFQFANSSADAAKSPFQFASSVNSPTDLSKTTFGSPSQGSNSAFGQVAPQQPKVAFAFGSAAKPINNGNSGQDNKSTFSFGSSGPTFGASGPTFGASAPTFGGSGPTFGAASPTFGASGPTFGAASPTFGASGPTFGSTNSSAPFGSGPTTQASFGSPANNTQSTLPSFGSLPVSKSSGFGSVPSSGSSGPSAFSFGSNASSGSGNSFQPNGSTTNNGAFAFGQSQDQAPPSFNFNASVTAFPNPAPQPPGLFSVGAGSAPSQRRVKDARRRR